jgi:large conductance mechanosensitive channel
MASRPGRAATTGFVKDFQAFILKGNVVELAVAVIIGGAFGKIVTSFVADIVMPFINPLVAFAGKDWRTFEVGPGIKIGSFFGSIIDFVIIGFVIFVVIQAIEKFKKSPAAEVAAPDPVLESQARLTDAIDRLTMSYESREG